MQSSALLTDEAAIKLIRLALRNMTPRLGARRNPRMDAAGAVDAKTAATGPWKTAQTAVSHSAHTHSPFLNTRSTASQTEFLTRPYVPDLSVVLSGAPRAIQAPHRVVLNFVKPVRLVCDLAMPHETKLIRQSVRVLVSDDKSR